MTSLIRRNGLRGRRHQTKAARKYRLRNIGAQNLPSDLQNALFNVQLKTHLTSPGNRPKIVEPASPDRWDEIFSAMDSMRDGRISVLLIRYTQQGVEPKDFFVIRGQDWADLHGDSEE